jgi:CrcB protein
MDSVLGRLVIIACGGGLGAVARYGLDAGARMWWPGLAARFPIGILMVNVTGCLLFGVVVGAAGGVQSLSPGARLFVLTGLLGGFTTFSSFGHDTARLMENGHAGLVLANAVGSVVLGVTGVFAGMGLGRLVAGG